MANSAGQSSPSNPAHLVGRVGRARKKPGPAQLEPWTNCIYFNQIVYILIKLQIL